MTDKTQELAEGSANAIQNLEDLVAEVAELHEADKLLDAIILLGDVYQATLRVKHRLCDEKGGGSMQAFNRLNERIDIHKG